MDDSKSVVKLMRKGSLGFDPFAVTQGDVELLKADLVAYLAALPIPGSSNPPTKQDLWHQWAQDYVEG